MKNFISTALLLVVMLALQAGLARAQSTEFTYQGSLNNGATAATGNYDFEFALFSTVSAGTQLGSTVTVSNVAVANGIFSAKIDFGNQFPGAGRFLEIRVRQTGGGAFTTLTPRQLVNSAPYSVKSLTAENATTAANSTQLGGVAANQYVLTGDARLSDARNPLPNSPNYVQNSTAQQSSSNFNISGNGTAGGTLAGNIVNAGAQYNFGGQQFLNAVSSNSLFGLETGAVNIGTNNTYAGYRAGNAAISNASNNSFFGANAGRMNSSGTNNSFFGSQSGQVNSSGGFNSFFGNNAGVANTVGHRNTFVGVTAGRDNIGGSDNAFFGLAAGQLNISGGDNSFFGTVAGGLNSTGSFNAFVGRGAGAANTTGSNNAFFGASAGSIQATGSNNTLIGSFSNITVDGLSFATAIGSASTVVTSNTIALGRSAGQDAVMIPGSLSVTGAINGTVSNATNATQLGGVAASQYVITTDTRLTDARTPTPGSANYIHNSAFPQSASNFNVSGSGTAGGTLSGNIVNTATQYDFNSQRLLGAPGNGNLFAGLFAGVANTTGQTNSFFGSSAGAANTTGNSNSFFGYNSGVNSNGGALSFFGTNTGSANTTGNSNAFFGMSAGLNNTSGSQNVFLGPGSGASNITGNNNTLLGRTSNVMSGNLNFATAIGADSTVAASNTIALGRSGGEDTVVIPGSLSVTGAINGTVSNATNATQLGGVAANQYVVTTDPRMTDARTPTAGSADYIQNGTTLQSASNFNISGSGTVGGTLSGDIVNAGTQFNLGSSRVLSVAGFDNVFAGIGSGAITTGGNNSFFGRNAGPNNTTGTFNSFFGREAGRDNAEGAFNSFFGSGAGARNTQSFGNSFFGYHAGFNNQAGGANNSFFGRSAGIANITGSNNTIIGHAANVGSGDLTYATAVGADAFVSTSNTIALGRSSGGDLVLIPGLLQVGNLDAAGATPICRNASNRISTCSSSFRYKTNIGQFTPGLAFVNKLRPISFDWKDGGMKDVGFGAEDIAKIDPRFVTYNDKGEVEGVKYDRFGVVLVNAVKEQQKIIEEQQRQIDEQAQIIRQQRELLDKQRSDFEALKKLVCAGDPASEICGGKK